MLAAIEAIRKLSPEEVTEWRALHHVDEGGPLPFSWKRLPDWTPAHMNAVVTALEDEIRKVSEEDLSQVLHTITEHNETLVLWYLCQLGRAALPHRPVSDLESPYLIGQVESWLKGQLFTNSMEDKAYAARTLVMSFSGNERYGLALALAEMAHAILQTHALRGLADQIQATRVHSTLRSGLGPLRSDLVLLKQSFSELLAKIRNAVWRANRFLMDELHETQHQQQREGGPPLPSLNDIVASSTRAALEGLRLPISTWL